MNLEEWYKHNKYKLKLTKEEIKLIAGFEALSTDAEQADDGCRHVWRPYTGFRESYEYCEKCDVKR